MHKFIHKEISTECYLCYKDFCVIIEWNETLDAPSSFIPHYCSDCEQKMSDRSNLSNEELYTENKLLKKWKEEALMVMNQWNEVSEYINKNGNTKDLGKSIPDLCLKYLTERDSLLKALKNLICTAEKEEINKNSLDQVLRRARNVIADADPTIVKCNCCY